MRYPTIQKELLAIIDSLLFFEAQLRENKFVILIDHKALLTFIQGTRDQQNLRRWHNLCMTFNCTIEHTTTKDKHITDAISTMYQYSTASTTNNDCIRHSVDSTTIRSLQKSLGTTSIFHATPLHLLSP